MFNHHSETERMKNGTTLKKVRRREEGAAGRKATCQEELGGVALRGRGRQWQHIGCFGQKPRDVPGF